MPKYHVNPENGNVGVCTAQIKCRLGGDEIHGATVEEAAKAYEKFATAEGLNGFGTVSKKSQRMLSYPQQIRNAEAIGHTELAALLKRQHLVSDLIAEGMLFGKGEPERMNKEFADNKVKIAQLEQQGPPNPDYKAPVSDRPQPTMEAQVRAQEALQAQKELKREQNRQVLESKERDHRQGWNSAVATLGASEKALANATPRGIAGLFKSDQVKRNIERLEEEVAYAKRRERAQWQRLQNTRKELEDAGIPFDDGSFGTTM